MLTMPRLPPNLPLPSPPHTHTSCSAPPPSSGNFGTGLNPPVGPRGLNGLGGSHMALGGGMMGGMGF